MVHGFDHLPNLKPLNLQLRQKTKNFYTKRLVRTLTMVFSWNLNYLSNLVRVPLPIGIRKWFQRIFTIFKIIIAGSIIKNEDGKIGDDVVFLTPQHLDFSLFSSSDASLNLSTVQCKFFEFILFFFVQFDLIWSNLVLLKVSKSRKQIMASWII